MSAKQRQMEGYCRLLAQQYCIAIARNGHLGLQVLPSEHRLVTLVLSEPVVNVCSFTYVSCDSIFSDSFLFLKQIIHFFLSHDCV